MYSVIDSMLSINSHRTFLAIKLAVKIFYRTDIIETNLRYFLNRFKIKMYLPCQIVSSPSSNIKSVRIIELPNHYLLFSTTLSLSVQNPTKGDSR